MEMRGAINLEEFVDDSPAFGEPRAFWLKLDAVPQIEADNGRGRALQRVQHVPTRRLVNEAFLQESREALSPKHIRISNNQVADAEMFVQLLQRIGECPHRHGVFDARVKERFN